VLTAPSPIAAAAAELDRADEHRTWRVGVPAGDAAWTRCTDVDSTYVAEWERAVAERHRADYGGSDPRAAAGYVLGWYAFLPGLLGGRLYARSRRVPRLDARALAFHLDPEHWPDAVALLDERFWCLPGDPAANDARATVVEDDAALAGVLRAQVRAHADAFLAGYRPGAKLPRRGLLGAFFDGLDQGVRSGHRPGPAARAAALADAATVLPGRTPEFAEASTLHELTDDRGRTHLVRERVSCCYYYRLPDGGGTCFTCPRTPAAERAARAAEWDEVM